MGERMNQIKLAKVAYDSVQDLLKNKYSYGIEVRTNIDPDSYQIKQSVESLTNAMKVWSHFYKTEVPLVFVSVDENGRQFLYEQLESLNFLDAMPKDDKWNESVAHTIFGSGGATLVDGKLTLLYWQVLGSKNSFTGTGNLKTGPHLFTHAIQGALYANHEVSQTDLPAWFVEGQADFLGLISNSNSFEEYWKHRIDFFRTAFVPGGDESRLKLANYSIEDWEQSLLNSPEKFDGIPLIDEYYTGLLAYEYLIYILGAKDVMDLYEEFIHADSLYYLIEKYCNITKNELANTLAPMLYDLGKSIYVQR